MVIDAWCGARIARNRLLARQFYGARLANVEESARCKGLRLM